MTAVTVHYINDTVCTYRGTFRTEVKPRQYVIEKEYKTVVIPMTSVLFLELEKK